jgi:hypothetical protein
MTAIIGIAGLLVGLIIAVVIGWGLWKPVVDAAPAHLEAGFQEMWLHGDLFYSATGDGLNAKEEFDCLAMLLQNSSY